MYDYKRAYFKIVQGLIKDYRFAHVTDPQLAAELFGTDPGFWNTLIYHRARFHTYSTHCMIKYRVEPNLDRVT